MSKSPFHQIPTKSMSGFSKWQPLTQNVRVPFWKLSYGDEPSRFC